MHSCHILSDIDHTCKTIFYYEGIFDHHLSVVLWMIFWFVNYFFQFLFRLLYIKSHFYLNFCILFLFALLFSFFHIWTFIIILLKIVNLVEEKNWLYSNFLPIKSMLIIKIHLLNFLSVCLTCLEFGPIDMAHVV